MNTYLTYQDISNLTGVSMATLRVWLVRGKLPPPDYKPHPKAALWKPKTIEEWLEERTNGSD